MKDVPHNLNKFLKQVAKHESPSGEEELEKAQKQNPSEKQIKKQKKLEQRKTKEQHAPEHPNLEEQNHKMKKRTPVFRKRAHKTPQK